MISLFSLSVRLCLGVSVCAHARVSSVCALLHPADENNFNSCSHGFINIQIFQRDNRDIFLFFSTSEQLVAHSSHITMI